MKNYGEYRKIKEETKKIIKTKKKESFLEFVQSINKYIGYGNKFFDRCRK